MRVLLGKKPDMTLKQLRESLALDCTLPAIHCVLEDMGLKTLRASEQDREDTARERKRGCRRQGGWDPARLVFLDESAAKTNRTRLRGRSPRGERLYASCPHGALMHNDDDLFYPHGWHPRLHDH